MKTTCFICGLPSHKFDKVDGVSPRLATKELSIDCVDKYPL